MEDVRNRKKSAYPNAQNPVYEAMTRDNAAIQPLLDPRAACSLMENNVTGIPGISLVSLFERIIQMNEWLKQYQVTLVL